MLGFCARHAATLPHVSGPDVWSGATLPHEEPPHHSRLKFPTLRHWVCPSYFSCVSAAYPALLLRLLRSPPRRASGSALKMARRNEKRVLPGVRRSMTKAQCPGLAAVFAR